MAIKTLLKNKTEELGKSENIVCPVCKKETELSLFSNYDADNYVAKILDMDTEFNFAVCPLCASVFKINMSSFGVMNAPLKDYHLILLRDGKNE